MTPPPRPPPNRSVFPPHRLPVTTQPPSQQPLAAATPVSAPRSAASQPLDPSMNTSTPATAPAARIAICTTTGPTTPSRRSALSRPKASPYKERSHPTAPPTAAALRGADEQPGPSQPAVTGDRLSGQLARLSAGAAGERREGRVAVGGVVEAAARGRGAGAARRETFQDSRALTKSGLVVPGARSMARRASSAGPAGEELNGGGSRLLERRWGTAVVEKVVRNVLFDSSVVKTAVYIMARQRSAGRCRSLFDFEAFTLSSLALLFLSWRKVWSREDARKRYCSPATAKPCCST